jgi:hypothetical protein
MAQDFSPTQLAPVVAKLNQMFDINSDVKFAPPVPSVMALATRQSVRFLNLDTTVNGNCRGVDIHNMSDDCEAVATNCQTSPSNDCTITGSDINSASTQLQNNMCLSAEFTVDTNLCGNSFSEADARAYGLSRAIAKIESAMNVDVLNKINAMPPRTPAAGTILDAILVNTYQIKLNSWLKTDNPVVDIRQISENNDLLNYYLLSGELLYTDYLIALDNTPACCDPAAQSLINGAVDITFDTRDLDPTLAGTPGDKAVLSIDPSATIFWNTYDFTPSPVFWGDTNATTVWRIQSPRLSFSNAGGAVPVWYDVMMQKSCGSSTSNRMAPVEKYKVQFKGGFHETPDSCAVDRGAKILHFTDGV